MAQASAGTLGKVLGNPVGEAAAFAAGLAIGPLLAPELEELRNATWSLYRSRAIDAMRVAEAVAQGHIDQPTGLQEASLSGISDDRFDKLVAFFRTGPGAAYAFELWRRGKINDSAFTRALQRAGLEDEWITALEEIKEHVLSVADIAVMVQRTILPNPGLLPHQPSTEGSNVPPMPQVAIDPVAEAAASGWTEDRLAALARIIGLPASNDLAARMYFRDIITEGAYNQAILEGNTRGEWAPFLLDGFREILTAHDYAELELRGFYDRDTRLANTGKHGMSTEDSDWLYDVIGRAPAAHAIATGLARGAKYPSVYTDVPEPYRAAIQRANVREEFADIVYHNRFSYPSLFQLNNLVKSKAILASDAEDWATKAGFAPEVVAAMGKFWTGEQAVAGPAKLTTEDKAAIRAVGKSYQLGRLDRIGAEAELVKIGLTSDDWNEKFVAWDVQRESTLKNLTDAQVRKAIKSGRYTLPEAVAILEGRGYTLDDATTYLTE